jgi:hypothetical protein
MSVALRASSSRSPRGSADDSELSSEEARGIADLAPQLSWARGRRVGVSGRRLLEPAKAASLFETHLANLGEPVNNRPFTLLLGSTRVENRPVGRALLALFSGVPTAVSELAAVGLTTINQVIYLLLDL